MTSMLLGVAGDGIIRMPRMLVAASPQRTPSRHTSQPPSNDETLSNQLPRRIRRRGRRGRRGHNSRDGLHEAWTEPELDASLPSDVPPPSLSLMREGPPNFPLPPGLAPTAGERSERRDRSVPGPSPPFLLPQDLSHGSIMLQRLAGIWYDVSGEVFVVASEALPLQPLTRDVVHVKPDGQLHVWRAALRWEMGNGCVYAVKNQCSAHVALVRDVGCLEWLPLHAGERPCRWLRLPGTMPGHPAGPGAALHPSMYN